MVSFLTMIAKALGSFVWQMLTWPQAWYVIGPTLLVIAVVLYLINRRKAEGTESLIRMPVFSFKTKTLALLTLAVIGGAVYAYNDLSTARTKVQFVNVSSAKNGTKTVSEDRLQDGVDIVLALDKQFVLCNSGGKYSAEVKLDGATPIVKVFKTSDVTTTIGGGFIHTPFDENQNAEVLCREIAGIISRTINSFEGTPTNEEKKPVLKLPQEAAKPSEETTPADDGVFHTKSLKKVGK